MIEELKKIRAILLENTNDFTSALDSSTSMLSLANKTETIYCNKAMRTFMKENKGGSVHESLLHNIHIEDLDTYNKILSAAHANQKDYEATYRLKSRNGQFIWVQEVGTQILFRGDDAYKWYLSGYVNISLQKNAEIKILSSEERYRRLFEAARDGILILNAENGKITDVNPFLLELLGYSKNEMVGLSLWEVGAFKNIDANKEIFRTLQENGFVKYDDLPLETKDGRLVPVGFVSNAYMVMGERVIQCNIRDISEQKRLEAAEKSLELLKQEKIKSAFIADVTHELRTPLAIIKGNVDLALRDKSTDASNKETYDAINVEVNHLAEILSNLSMLTNDNPTFFHAIEKKKVEVRAVILEVVSRLKKLSQTRNITIEIKNIPEAILFFNRNYLEKLFSNIISNAIYYGKEKGSVVIDAKLTTSHIEITIKDNGMGIREEDLPNVFERFYRTKEVREINTEGTGLGLAISKWIVDAHKGTIAVTSTLSVGTTFTVTFPLAP